MRPLWQTNEWEEFQNSLGHETLRVEGELMIIQGLFLGMSYGYMPRGPARPQDNFLDELLKTALKRNLIFTRLDPEKEFKINDVSVRNTSSVQPETTLLLDLSMSEKEILEQMKRKGRYNIHLAEKKGVTVRQARGDEERKAYCHMFFSILKETTERDVFSGHEESYYQKLLKHVQYSEVFIAFIDEQPISGAICTFQKDRAIYYYGASGNEHRGLMAPYLVQWEAIKEAKKRGCKTYDFLGIAPEDALESHPWRGITEFKKKFGGSVVRYPKPRDIIHRPFWYTVYKGLKIFQKILKK